MDTNRNSSAPAGTALPLYHNIVNPVVETDIQLILQVQKQRRAAMETLYDRYAANGMGLAYHILQDTSAAEDVVIEAFWWVWRFAFMFRSAEGSFADWFLGFVQHLAHKELSSRNARLELTSQVETHQHS
jgi:DNA-directed RNA polymerase specialized sigma24 family protein